MSTSSVQPQKPALPRNLVIIVVALGVIAALSTLGLLVTGFGLGRLAFNRGNLPNNFQGGNLQGGNGNFQGGGNSQGGDNGNAPQGNGGNFQGGNGTFQRRGNASLFSAAGIARRLGLNFQVIRYITLVFGLIGIALTIVTAVYVWKRKRWALNLAIVLAILFLLGSLPGFFSFGRFFSVITVLTASSNILKGLATLPIIVLGILPSVRDSVS